MRTQPFEKLDFNDESPVYDRGCNSNNVASRPMFRKKKTSDFSNGL
jgi:hypothetical protein